MQPKNSAIFKHFGSGSTAFAGLFGYPGFAGGFDGGQAEHVRCPLADHNLLKIPYSLPDEMALYLNDIIPTWFHSTFCADVNEGKRVAIWGLGPVGLFACQWSKLAGARRVVGVARVRSHLALAQKRIECDVIKFDERKNVVSE
jgi:threonine dehydrogenase-like Zn-dependent dehydrogenase